MDSTQSKARANNRRRGSVVESVSSSLGLRPVVSVANIFTSIPYGELELKCGVLEKMTHAAGAAEWVHGHTLSVRRHLSNANLAACGTHRARATTADAPCAHM